jgi:hypothetical protein
MTIKRTHTNTHAHKAHDLFTLLEKQTTGNRRALVLVSRTMSQFNFSFRNPDPV